VGGLADKENGVGAFFDIGGKAAVAFVAGTGCLSAGFFFSPRSLVLDALVTFSGVVPYRASAPSATDDACTSFTFFGIGKDNFPLETISQSDLKDIEGVENVGFALGDKASYT
jgi:hypothetical protein